MTPCERLGVGHVFWTFDFCDDPGHEWQTQTLHSWCMRCQIPMGFTPGCASSFDPTPWTPECE